MGMVSAQREVLRFIGMGAVQESPPRGVVVLMSHTQKIQACLKGFREILR